MDQASFVDALNEDLALEFKSIVQYVQHVTVIEGPQFMSVVDELKVHTGQELQHAQVLAEQISFLGGTPTTEVPEVAAPGDSQACLQADLDLERTQLDRYRERFQQAMDLGLADVAEALRPLLEQTQEHVRDLDSVVSA